MDAHYVCADCQAPFVWSVAEQRAWFETYQLYVESHPTRCLECRAARRHLQALRTEYDETVTAIRERGTAEQKRWIIDLIDELEAGHGSLADGLLETRRVLQAHLRNGTYGTEEAAPTVRGNRITARCAEMRDVVERGKSADGIAFLESCLKDEAVDVQRSALNKLKNWQAHDCVPAVMDFCEHVCRDGDSHGIIPAIVCCLAALDTSGHHERIIRLYVDTRDFNLRHYIAYVCEDIDYADARDQLVAEWERETDETLLHSLLKADLSFRNSDATLIRLAAMHPSKKIHGLGISMRAVYHAFFA